MHSEHMDHLEKTWGFRCECSFCTAEMSGTSSRRAECYRYEQLALTAWDKGEENFHASTVVMSQARALYRQVESVYTEPQFACLPKVDLGVLCEWMCRMAHTLNDFESLAELAVAGLGNLAYGITIKKDRVEFDEECCFCIQSAVDAAAYASLGYEALG